MENAVPLSGIPQAPTRARYGVVGFAVTLAVITYIDRVCIAKAAPHVMRDLRLDDWQWSWVLTSFSLAYGLFEIPWGWLGDKIGARKVLMRIVVCWSFFTMATGWAWGFWSLVATRALFGMGEAGAFPNLTKTFTTWLPFHERVRAQGILWLSARWGGAFTPLLVTAVMLFVSWRSAFAIFGAIGIVWAFFFYRWYRDEPRDHPSVNDAERALLPTDAGRAGHVPTPWGLFLRSPRVWLLWTQYFFLAYAAMFYITWLPPWMDRTYPELSPGFRSLLTASPLFFAGIGSLFCGFFLSRLTAWVGNPDRARRWMASTGFLGSSLATVAFIHIQDPVWKMAALGVAGFSNDLVMPSSWGACMDLGRKYAGTLSGSMNMMGCAGAALFPIAAERLKAWTGGNWDAVFYVSAGVYFLGIFCWLFLDSVTPLEKGREEATA